mmetsp:Transcript_69524/g.193445  ORF Transcript_69524/g.193445 Transcript_69524/m.193445 type:complete len:228 (-) Transcript_69524:342-1025(-)
MPWHGLAHAGPISLTYVPRHRPQPKLGSKTPRLADDTASAQGPSAWLKRTWQCPSASSCASAGRTLPGHMRYMGAALELATDMMSLSICSCPPLYPGGPFKWAMPSPSLRPGPPFGCIAAMLSLSMYSPQPPPDLFGGANGIFAGSLGVVMPYGASSPPKDPIDFDAAFVVDAAMMSLSTRCSALPGSPPFDFGAKGRSWSNGRGRIFFGWGGPPSPSTFGIAALPG